MIDRAFFNSIGTSEYRKPELSKVDQIKKNWFYNTHGNSKKFVRITDNEWSRELINTLYLEQPSAIAVLFYLVYKMDNLNSCYTSYNTIANDLALSRRAVAYALESLYQKDLVYFDSTTSAYIVSPLFAWGSNMKNLEYVSSVLPETMKREGYLPCLSFDKTKKAATYMITLFRKDRTAFYAFIRLLFEDLSKKNRIKHSIIRLAIHFKKSICSIKRYIKKMIRLGLLRISGKQSFEINATIAWRSDFGINKYSFTSDIAGIREERAKNRQRYFADKSIDLRYRTQENLYINKLRHSA